MTDFKLGTEVVHHHGKQTEPQAVANFLAELNDFNKLISGKDSTVSQNLAHYNFKKLDNELHKSHNGTPAELDSHLHASAVYKIDVGMPKEPIFVFDTVFEGGLLVNKEDLIAALVAACLVMALSLFFQKTSTGRALRAVADDHQAAQSIGIPLNRMWVIVWFVAGLTALVAGIIWGSKIGVQFSLTTVALKALPVIILGGLTSVPGAIIGGLIIGVGEKVSEVYLGPMIGGGIELWFAYVLALVFLLFRPQGLFGEKIIDRV